MTRMSNHASSQCCGGRHRQPKQQESEIHAGRERAALWRLGWHSYCWCQRRRTGLVRAEVSRCRATLVSAPHGTWKCERGRRPLGNLHTLSQVQPDIWFLLHVESAAWLLWSLPRKWVRDLVKPCGVMVCWLTPLWLHSHLPMATRKGRAGAGPTRQMGNPNAFLGALWMFTDIVSLITHISDLAYFSKKGDSRHKHLQDVLGGSGHFKTWKCRFSILSSNLPLLFLHTALQGPAGSGVVVPEPGW